MAKWGYCVRHIRIWLFLMFFTR